MQVFLDFIKAHKKFFSILVSCVLGLLILGYLLTQAKSCYNNYKLQQDYQNLNVAVQQKANIEANLANLQQQYANAEVNANISKEQRQEIGNKVNAAKIETNQAIENVNTAVNTISNGATVDEANKARCLAFPQSPECQ